MSSVILAVTHHGDESTARRTWYARLKHLLDATLALLGLILSMPVLLPAALLVKLTSRGPMLYSQIRLGLGGRPFRIYKLRTMSHNCEALSGPCWSTKGDPRVTAFGRFLRRTHIDELPQLWNILVGDMSLVGPRPERPEMVRTLEQVIPRYRERMAERPGLTGLAQVQLPPDTDLNSVRSKLAHDLYYLERVGFWFDLRILLATVGSVLGVPSAATCALLALPGGKGVQQHFDRRSEDSTVGPQQHAARGAVDGSSGGQPAAIPELQSV
jgi:lipopolysaccharide/colanic/teichoic acid biosynthesis glycosyltransferase